MATLPGINAGALKITFPANLPKNEKDLICMLLAGRLKDLWKGKLFCAELAVNDLIKDVTDKMDGATGTGLDVLKELRSGLGGLQTAITGMKAASGYDTILNKVNQALGQMSNVFSLGGLCPSPVTPPKIPDVLANLNQNLFGQATNVLNALAQASTPKMCFGAGPAGFGVNWNSMNGSLRNLKNALKNFKNTPTQVLRQFAANLRGQERRLKAELARLKKNLQDPLGIGKQQGVAKSLQRAKNISGDYKVKDRNGVEHQDPIRSMIPGDIGNVLNNTDPVANQPVLYKTEPVLDYCGNIVGFKKVALSGDPNYIGWDTAPGAVNSLNPTTNPVAGYQDYDYTYVEENGTVNIYDKNSVLVSEPTIERGKNYKIGFFLKTAEVAFYKDGARYTEGMTVAQNPAYGKGAGAPGVDIVEPNSMYNPTYKTGEVEWAAQKSLSTSGITWAALALGTGAIIKRGGFSLSGPTSIPPEDRSYDLAMAFKKALIHLKTVDIGEKQRDTADKSINRTVILNAKLSNGQTLNNNWQVSCVKHKDEDYYFRFPYMDPTTLEEIAGTGALTYTPPAEDFTRRTEHQRSDVVTRDDAIRLDCKLARYDLHPTDPAYPVASGYYISPNYDLSEGRGDFEEGNSEFRVVTTLGTYSLVFKFHLGESDGLTIEQLSWYLSTNVRDPNYYIPLASVDLTDRLTVMNDTKLPFNDPYSYRMSLPLADAMSSVKDYNLYDDDEAVYSIDGTTLKCQFTRYSEADIASMPENEFVLIIEVDDKGDIKRTYENTNPTLKRLRFYAKGLNGTFIDYQIT